MIVRKVSNIPIHFVCNKIHFSLKTEKKLMFAVLHTCFSRYVPAGSIDEIR